MTAASPQDTVRQLLLALIRTPLEREQADILLQANPNWDELAGQALRHEIFPLIYQGLKPFADRVPTEVLTHYQALHAQNTLRNLQLRKELENIVALLLEAGIPVIPYKGPLLAETAYGDLALRSFRDLDLLVPPEQALEAIRLLEGKGYRLDFELTDRRWPSLVKTVNHLFQQDPERGWGVEVHWMAFHPMYVLPFELDHHWQALRSNGQVRSGRLSLEENLVLLCAHGTKHQWQSLKWIVDIQRLCGRCGPIDWPRVWSLADRSHSSRSVRLGLALAGRIGELDLPEAVADRIRTDRTAGVLAEDVWAGLFRDNPEKRNFYREYSFQLRSSDRFIDRWRQIFRWLFYPRLADWLACPPGDRCFALFHLQRAARMSGKWIISPVCRRIGEAAGGRSRVSPRNGE